MARRLRQYEKSDRMSSASDDQIRYAILEVLHKAARDNPTSFGLDRDKMQEILKIPENRIEFNMPYLEEKGLVKRSGFMGPPYWFATITAFGMDVVEHKELYASQLPFIQVTIQQIQGNIQGNIIQAVNSHINFSQQVTDAFKKAYSTVETKTNVSLEQKEEIKKNLKILDEELQNTKKDAGKIQKAWDWLQRNANWLIPTLTQVVSDGIKIAFGMP